MSNSPKKKEKYKFKAGQTVYYIDDWYRESFDDPDCDTLEWISPGTIDRAFSELEEAKAFMIEKVSGDLKALSKNLKALKNIREED